MIRPSSASPAAATHLRVAAAQTAPTRDDPAGNLCELEDAIAGASGADLAVTCELSVSGFAVRPDQLPQAMNAEDGRLRRLASLGPAVGLGFVEENPAGRPFNSYAVFGDTPSIQRKLHPVSYPPWNEHELVTRGATFELGRVRGVPTATLICNDAWHPVMPWLAALAGAEILLIPAASLGAGEDHASARSWELILTHAARILQCYVVFVNRVGTEDGLSFWGGSRILGPTGLTLARAGSGTETIQADLDLDFLRRLRRDIPLLNEARPELVAEILAAHDTEHDSV